MSLFDDGQLHPFCFIVCVHMFIKAFRPFRPFKFCLYFTVLQNFSRKSRKTVSVREGQAVVLLCGPPPHYGGTLLGLNSLLHHLMYLNTPACLSNLHCPSLLLIILLWHCCHCFLNSDTLFPTHFSLSVSEGTFMICRCSTCADSCLHISSSYDLFTCCHL